MPGNPVKLGDVLRKERQRGGLSVKQIAAALAVGVGDYEKLEGGESPAERWGPILAAIAIELETPTSRLLAISGRAADTRAGQAGPLIRAHRERRGRTPEEMAKAVGVAPAEYLSIEQGESLLEAVGPQLLKFAEAIDQPVFNLLYPCGLPFQELDDYP